MISAVPNPALAAFAALIAPELVFGEILLQKVSDGCELRHAADREAPALRIVPVEELREIAEFTEGRRFRPLRSAPTLRRGWRCLARHDAELERALQCLYPGGVADWFAAQQPNPPAANYRDFTARQTGMYRITTMLADEQVAQVARAGCHKTFCLKRRLWTAEGLPAEAGPEKSLLACLEPCALLLEFARTVVRSEQQEKRGVKFSPDELASMTAALAGMLAAPRLELREADYGAPENARRMRWLLNKLDLELAKKGENENR